MPAIVYHLTAEAFKTKHLMYLNSNISEDFIKEQVLASFNENQYVVAATTDTDDIEEAYTVTNSSTCHWFYHDGVIASGNSKRGTTVGDVIEQNGVRHFVCIEGFIKL